MLPAEPAPVLTIVANRQPGWNHYQITTHIPDPSVYFSDAQIVWMLTAQEGCARPPCAFSANPTVAARTRIENTGLKDSVAQGMGRDRPAATARCAGCAAQNAARSRFRGAGHFWHT